MLACRYLANNPFRILGIGSATSYPELRQKARGASIAAQAGIRPESGLSQLFDEPDLALCASGVAALATDPCRLALYRIFWPAQYQPEPEDDGTLADLRRRWERAHAGESPEAVHLGFLVTWFDFFAEPESERLYVMLDHYSDFDLGCKSSPSLDEFLGLESSDPEADDVLEDLEAIRREFEDYLVGSIARTAFSLCNSGEVERGCELLAPLRCYFCQDALSRGLSEIAPLGNAAAEAIRNLPVPTGAAVEAQPLRVPEQVEQLWLPSREMEEHLAQAGQWSYICQNYIHRLTSEAFGYAVNLANEHFEYERSEAILEQLYELPLSPEWQSAVEESLCTVAELLTEEETTGELDLTPEPDVGLLEETAEEEAAEEAAKEEGGYQVPVSRPLGWFHRAWSNLVIVALVLFLIWHIGRGAGGDGSSYSTNQPDRVAGPNEPSGTSPDTVVSEPLSPDPEMHAEEVEPPALERGYSAGDVPTSPDPAPQPETALSSGDVYPETAADTLTPGAEATAETPQEDPVNQNLARLKELMDTARRELERLKSLLDADDRKIAEMDTEIDELAARLDPLRRAIQAAETASRDGLEIDEAAYDRDLDEHNAIVGIHNAKAAQRKQLVTARNRRADEYEAVRMDHNRIVRDYNELLGSAR